VSSTDHHSLEHHARRILVLQAVLGVLLVLLILAHGRYADSAVQATENAFAGLYGVLLGMLGTLIAKRSAARSGRAALKVPHYAMAPVYLGMLNKLLVVGGGLAVGMVALELGPVYIVSGYLVSHLAFIWVAARRA